MALDKKKSVYEIAIEIGGRIDQSLGRTVGRTKKEMDGLEGSFAKMNKTVSGLKNFIGGSLIVAGGTFLINKLKNVAGSAIDAASEMETYRATLNTVLKDEKRAGEMVAWATDFAAHTPFNTGDIVDAVTRLEAYGFKSQTMMENIGNMASAMNKDLPTAVEAVYKATLGEMELMENNFAITKKLIKEKSQEWYGQAAVNASGAIANAELYNNTLLRLIEEKFEGGMERQSKTWAGIKSNMEDSKEAILRKIAGMDAEGQAKENSLYARVLSMGAFASGELSKLAAHELMDTIASGFGAVGGFLEKALGTIATGSLPSLLTGVNELLGGVKDVALRADDLVKKLTGGKGTVDLIVEGVDLALQGVGALTEQTGNVLQDATVPGVKKVKSDPILDWIIDASEWVLGEQNMLKDMLVGADADLGRFTNFVYDIGKGTKTNTEKSLREKGFGEGLTKLFTQEPHPRLTSFTTGDIVVNVTTQPGDDANAIGRTVGERVREAIAEAQHQNNRTRFTPQLAK